jgi:hypothetical protein
MLVSGLQTTAAWIVQSWEDNKTSLLANRHITLMSSNHYHMVHYTWMMPQ